MKSKLVIRLLIATAVAIGIVIYAPSVLYVLSFVGLTPEPIVSGVVIEMGPRWYPILSSERGIGRWIMNTQRPTLVLFKAAWPFPGRDNVISVTHYSPEENGAFLKASHMVTSRARYQWGEVIFMREYGLVLIEPFGIGLSNDLSWESRQLAVGEISHVQFRVTK